MRLLLKISVKQWKGLKKKGYRIDSVPMRRLQAMTSLEKKTWLVKDGFLILEATV